MPTSDDTITLILAPLGQDAPAMAGILHAQNIATRTCENPAECALAMSGGVGALLLTEESLELPEISSLFDALKSQPPWSELPVIILTHGGEARVNSLLDLAAAAAGTATLLERPMSATTLLRSVQVALRSRRRQYQVRDLLLQQQRHQEAIQQERDRLAALLNSMTDEVWFADANKNVTLINPAARNELGPAIGDARTIEKIATSLEVLRPDGTRRPPEEAPLLRALLGETVSNQEEMIRSLATGKLRHRQVNAAPVRGPDGCIIGSVSVVRDITDRKQAEQALRESEEQFRAMFNVASLGKTQADPSTGRLLRVNAAMCRITGYSETELLARTIRDLTHPEDRDTDWAAFCRMANGEATDYQNEKRYVRADGQIIWVHASANLIRDAAGKPIRTTAIIQDITQRKRAEDALRESEERAHQQLVELESIYGAAPVGLCVFDRDLRYRRINQRLAEMNGLPVEAHIGKTAREVVPALGEQAEEVIRKVIASGKPVRFHFKGQTAAQPGVERIWDEQWFPLGDGGQVEAVGVVVEDITERIAFQEELQRLVNERTAKLHELVGELEHLSYTITHDMRAPLRAIRGFAEAIQEICSDRPNPELDGLVRRMSQGAERMDLLITDALQYTKAVRQELPLAPVDLGALLRGMLDTYPEFITANIRLEVPILPVMGNEAALTQCFSNLLGNALKFVKPGEPPQVRVWSERRHEVQEAGHRNGPAEWVRIWVEDKGIGISANMRPKLFQMFSRASRNYEGTGIGLALVRKVVQRMGGRVGVDSQQGQGSCFWVELRPGDVTGASDWEGQGPETQR